MLHPRLYHPSRGSRSHTVWTIKPITKIRVTHLPQPTSSTTKPNHNVTLPIASIPPLYIWHMFQANTYPYLLLAPRPNRSTLSPTANKRYSAANNALPPNQRPLIYNCGSPLQKAGSIKISAPSPVSVTKSSNFQHR